MATFFTPIIQEIEVTGCKKPGRTMAYNSNGYFSHLNTSRTWKDWLFKKAAHARRRAGSAVADTSGPENVEIQIAYSSDHGNVEI